MSDPIYIWLRETVDWSSERSSMEELRPAIGGKAQVWNRTFSIPYHAFRGRVAEIAQLNLSRVDGAVVAEWDEIPEGALVVPVDDDDWFAPDAATAIRSQWSPSDQAALGCYWTSSWLEVPTNFMHRMHLIKQRLMPWRGPHWVFTTNNYALRKSAGTKWLLFRHVYASRWGTGGGLDRMRRIERRLSLQNRTLASQTSMGMWEPEVSAATLRRKFHPYRHLYGEADLTGVEWAAPYVERMGELMDELELLKAPA